MTRRKQPTLREKLASALLMMVRPDEHGKMVPVIPFERAKTMTAREVIAHFHFDHVRFVAFDGDNHPANLVPRPVAEHIEKTKRDVKEIAKVRRGLKRRAAKRPLDKNGYPTGDDLPLAPGENPIVDARHKRRVSALMRKARREHATGKSKPKAKIPSRPFPSREQRKAWKEQRGLA